MKIERQSIQESMNLIPSFGGLTIQQIIDQAPVIMWLTDTSGECVYFNRRWYAFTGQSPETALKSGWINAVHIDDSNDVQKTFGRRSKQPAEASLEYRLKSKSGDYRWVFAQAAPLYDNNATFIGYAGSITDINEAKLAAEKEQPIFNSAGDCTGVINVIIDNTARKIAEQRLETLKRDLEEEVGKRTKQLKEMNEALVRANNDLEQYAWIASHDLQEPLRKIRFFANLLSHRLGETQDSQILSRIETSARKMSLLIKDVHNYSTLLKGTTEFVAVNLNQVARETLMLYEDEIANKKAMVTVGTLPTVEGVYSQLLLLFTNLLGNALTFSNAAPAIAITGEKVNIRADTPVLPEAQRERYVKISFKDNGDGFDEAYTEKIFDIFQRLHGNGSHTGNGMGLPLCKKVVENHRGAITARSRKGIGSTFEVYLPLQKVQEVRDTKI